jgi:DNA-directed RNA polymerase specialized sigma24 family protein
VILLAGLQPGLPALRWSIATAHPAAQDPSRKALVRAAVAALDAGTRRRDPIAVDSGDARTDALLADLAPGFAALLAGLTDRQREAGRLLLMDGLRRSEVAAVLGISRPTVSVMVDRARLLEIERLARGLDAILTTGMPAVVRPGRSGPGS